MLHNSQRRPPNRRELGAEETRRAVLVAARATFAEQGYVEASLDALVARAGVTKGALYHHFGSKLGLFEAVYTEMELELVAQVGAALERSAEDPKARLVAAFDAFLEVSTDPAYARVVLLEAPPVLVGRGREIDRQVGLTQTADLLAAYLGEDSPFDLEMVASLVLAATGDLAIAMAKSADPGPVRAKGRAVILAMLSGLGG